jgi:ATP synthase protein I
MADGRRSSMSGSRRFGAAYQGAFEAVFSIGIGAGLGHWVDRRFSSEPWGVLTGLALGFGAFVLRLVRLAREMAKDEGPQDGPPDGRDGG